MARPATLFAEIKTSQQRDRLVELWKQHPNHYTRMRGHAIILSASGYEVSQLVDIFGIERDTAASWVRRFNEGGVDALFDDDRPGGPRKLNEEEQQLLECLLREYPSQPAKVLAQLKEKTGKLISRKSLSRYAKRFNFSWKRFRRSLRQRRDEQAFRLAQEELAELLEEPGLDVVYFDEAGFSLKGVVPYGWLKVGQRTEVPVTGAHGSTIQALGFQHQSGGAQTYLHKGYVNTTTVIAALDDFCNTIDQTGKRTLRANDERRVDSYYRARGCFPRARLLLMTSVLRPERHTLQPSPHVYTVWAFFRWCEHKPKLRHNA